MVYYFSRYSRFIIRYSWMGRAQRTMSKINNLIFMIFHISSQYSDKALCAYLHGPFFTGSLSPLQYLLLNAFLILIPPFYRCQSLSNLSKWASNRRRRNLLARWGGGERVSSTFKLLFVIRLEFLLKFYVNHFRIALLWRRRWIG